MSGFAIVGVVLIGGFALALGLIIHSIATEGRRTK